jgi:energy-coupling factor transporter ATP-binding protein EcfA2
MFIHTLVLHRCKRFSLRGIDTLTIKPELKTQMVLGSNGAGKSSLLRIGFTVMPAQASDFHKGGYKSIGLAHNGKMYELGTIFEKGSPEHVFICNGDDLNVGRTGAVQKELLREHFGMTQEIHDVLTGEERFTDMSPLRRRDWITKLSSTDFTYVLNLYARVKKGARDASAVVKHNTGRLVTESSKLMEQSDLDMLVNRSKELRSELDMLLQECSNSGDNHQMISNQIAMEFNELDKLVKGILKRTNLTPPNHFRIRHMEELDKEIGNLSIQIKSLESVLSELGHMSQQYESQMQRLKAIEGMDEEYIRTQLKKLNQEVEENLRHLHTGELVENIAHSVSAMSTIEEFKTMLYPVTSGLMDRYDTPTVMEKRQYLERLYAAKNTLTTRLGNLEGRLQHIETCSETGCPKCGHSFKAGVEEGEHVNLLESRKAGEAREKEMNALISETREFLEGADQYQGIVNTIQRFRQKHSALSNFWGYIDRAGGLGKGKELIPAINLYLNDAAVAAVVMDLDHQIKPLKESIDSIEKIGRDGNSIREQYYAYTSRIKEVTFEIREKDKHLNELEDYKSRQDRFDKDIATMMMNLCRLDKLQNDLIESIRQSEIRDLVKSNQISLAMVETTLTETEIQTGIVNDIRKEIDQVSVEEKAYKLLMDALSPVDGLIAEQISIYINAIINSMNAVIGRIWGYNMAIKPCDIADGDLDYKFPLYTVSEDNEIPDISKGSTSQVDIINQAFRLVVYKYLDLHGYPLYLDELGSSFDEVHRHNLVPAIKDLIDDTTYSQIFMISHYVDGQNSFPNSEIVVLDDTHINIKRTYNEHVTFS